MGSSQRLWNPVFSIANAEVDPENPLTHSYLQDVQNQARPNYDLQFLLSTVGGVVPVGRAPQQLAFGTFPPTQQQALNENNLLLESLNSLHIEVAQLRTQVRQLQKKRTFVVPLVSLAPEPFEIAGQIPVTIEGDGEDFTATFMEANVSASGETEADALANFKDSLVSSFETLESFDSEELGPLPLRQWTILRSIIKRID
jgi:hypothetical protein